MITIFDMTDIVRITGGKYSENLAFDVFLLYHPQKRKKYLTISVWHVGSLKVGIQKHWVVHRYQNLRKCSDNDSKASHKMGNLCQPDLSKVGGGHGGEVDFVPLFWQCVLALTETDRRGLSRNATLCFY